MAGLSSESFTTHVLCVCFFFIFLYLDFEVTIPLFSLLLRNNWRQTAKPKTLLQMNPSLSTSQISEHSPAANPLFYLKSSHFKTRMKLKRISM